MNESFVKDRINSAVSSLPPNVGLRFEKLSLKKQFPYIFISIGSAELGYKNTLKAGIRGVQDKISLVKFLISYITGQAYYGSIHAKMANIQLNKLKKTKSKGINGLPVLPVDIKIDRLKVKYAKNIFQGVFEGSLIPVSRQYNLKINGMLNDMPVSVSAKVKTERFSAEFNLKTGRLFNVYVNGIRGSISSNNLTSFNINLKSDFVSYSVIKMKKPELDVHFDIAPNGFNISSLNINSENGYAGSLKGFIDTKKYPNSNVEGEVSTPYINIKPFIPLVGKKIYEYMKGGYISLSKIKFKGSPSMKFVKSGNVGIKSLSFRIDKKSSTFFIKQGIIKITPALLKVSAKGHFEDVFFRDSTVTIHRTKGYPCDMDLKYSGVANDLARIFLEENIFSKNDLKVLGKSSALQGRFSATTKIEGYRWAAKPFFNFDIVIHSNGVEFYNSNIPSRFIQSWGVVQIKRVMERGRVKTLFVGLKNMKAKGLASNVQTGEFTIFIKPKLVFKGSLDAKLSKNDTNYLINAVMAKRFNIARNSLEIKAYIDGPPEDFKYKGTINYVVNINKKRSMPFRISCFGMFKNGILDIENMKLNDYLQAQGFVDMKHLSFDLGVALKNLNINTIKSLIKKEKIFILSAGILNGNVHVTGDMNKPVKTIKGNVELSGGYISKDINSINGKIAFNSNMAKIDNASAEVFQTPVTFNGLIHYSDNLSINLHSFADNLTLDISSVQKENKNAAGMSLKIPEVYINASLNIKNLYIKNKNRIKNLKKTRIELINTPIYSFFGFDSNKTGIKISRKNRHINANIKDYNIFSFLTDCQRKDNLFKLKADLQTSDEHRLDIGKLKGNIDIFSKNGKFKNVSNALKVLSLTNVMELIFGKSKLKKDLPYEKITAPLFIDKGILKTRKNSIVSIYGDNLDIFLDGKYDIMKKYLDIYATFTTLRSINKLVSKIPVIGWIIGGKQKSFTGVNVRIKGYVGKNISVKPVPLEGLGKGLFGIIKRAVMSPFNAIGVGK